MPQSTVTQLGHEQPPVQLPASHATPTPSGAYVPLHPLQTCQQLTANRTLRPRKPGPYCRGASFHGVSSSNNLNTVLAHTVLDELCLQ